MKRIFLLAGAIGWGISILGVILPWRIVDMVLQNLGAARDLFRLRPEDSLFDLYDSYYKTGRKTAFFLATDNMELEECGEVFEDLCRFSGAEFDCRKSLHDELRTIAANRKNQPPTADEIKSLRLTMRFLSYLT